jgi:hypothetical protein
MGKLRTLTLHENCITEHHYERLKKNRYEQLTKLSIGCSRYSKTHLKDINDLMLEILLAQNYFPNLTEIFVDPNIFNRGDRIVACHNIKYNKYDGHAVNFKHLS